MRTCPQCGETIADGFDSCWKCAGRQQAAEGLRAARKAERHSARPPTTRGTALWYSGGVPLLVQLALAGLLIADGARHNGSWMGMWGWFFLLLGVIPTTIINLIVTLFWYNEARWFLVLRGLVIALVLPVIILFGI